MSGDPIQWALFLRPEHGLLTAFESQLAEKGIELGEQPTFNPFDLLNDGPGALDIAQLVVETAEGGGAMSGLIPDN
jgi:hypothetical protein